MEKLLTIVVPTYNISQYIEKNIKQFHKVNKNYQRQYEVLIVNDGSTDNTEDVIHHLIDDVETNIRLINKQNGGHGSTINRGLAEAQGKYFKVIDGDDWIDVVAFEAYLDVLTKIETDMVITDFTEQHVYNQTTKLMSFPTLASNKLIQGLPDERIPMHAVTYKTKLLRDNQIRLSEKTFYVDIQYTLFPLEYIKSYYYAPLNVYQYFLGRSDQSMNMNSMIKNAKDHLTVIKSVLALYDKKNKDTNLQKIIDANLKYLIKTQIIISYLSNSRRVLLTDLLQAIKNSAYEYKFGKKNKTVYLIYLNHIINYKLNFIFEPIINRQINKRREV